MFQKFMQIISLWALPAILILILTMGLFKKVPLYETFTDGAKDGFKVAVNIIPYLVAIIVGISMFRASGIVEMISNLCSPVLSHFNVITTIEKLENVFKLGIRKFTSSEIINYAIGAFYHDTTMLNMMDFVPTDEFIKDGDFKDFHTSKAYYFLKYVMNQKDESSLIAGQHHECYGYGSGILKNFVNKKINDPKYKVEFLMTFEPDDIINAEALAYFPAKMLEIVDIYDSLTFMGGSRNENPSEVVMFMRENFIEDKIKIDPIIFNLFVQFLSEVKGIELPSED